jgi:hypothetical protein
MTSSELTILRQLSHRLSGFTSTIGRAENATHHAIRYSASNQVCVQHPPWLQLRSQDERLNFWLSSVDQVLSDQLSRRSVHGT